MKKGYRIVEKDNRRVIEGLSYYKKDKVSDLRELVKGSAKKYGDSIGFKFKDKNGTIIGKTYNEFNTEIDSLGTALLSLGLKNEHISIISENRYEWGLCYFSIINGTGVGVPLDKYLPENEVENLVNRAGVKAIFYSPSFHEIMIHLSKTNESLNYYICMEEYDKFPKDDSRFLTISKLIEKGSNLIESGDMSFITAPIDKEKMSILLFTSGTTSMAKGVMLSHRNIASNVSSMTGIIDAGPSDVHLSLLPLHHTFENSIGLMFMLHKGVCIAYCDGIKHIVKNLHEYNVTVLVAVPAILEAMYKKLQEGIKKSRKEKILKLMIRVSDFLRIFKIDIRKQLFKSVFEKLGPNLRLAVSGAAPLDPEVVVGFQKIGLNLIQGYGLTESSPVLAANNDFINIPGTNGYPLPDIEMAIDSPDENGIGEIIARGPNIMLGYYKNPAATSDVLDNDGWFRTGDLGNIDEKGIVRITGRAKSMIVLDNGKKAFPEEYEVLINNIPGVKESFVWGNKSLKGNIEICAKIVIDKENLSSETGILLSKTEITKKVESFIREINKTIPKYKIIRYFVIDLDDLIKTTTLKIKRNIETDKIRMYLEKKGVDIRKISGQYID